jgi:hypothetical protein
MEAVDQIELIGSVQFHLPVDRANSGLMPGEVVFQPHHIDAGGLVRLIITIMFLRLLSVCRVRGPRRPLALRMSLLEWSGRAIGDRCRLVSRISFYCIGDPLLMVD